MMLTKNSSYKLIGCLIATLFISFTAVARDLSPEGQIYCKPQALTNPLVAGRAKSITFPDGRVLTVVGHMHGNRQIYEVSDLIDSGELRSMSNDKFSELVSRIQNENAEPYEGLATMQSRKKVADHFKDEYGIDVSHIISPEDGLNLPSINAEQHALNDYKFLNQTLKPNTSSIQFIGFEGSQQTWNNNFPYYLRARSELVREFNIRRTQGSIQLSQQDFEKLILSASNGSVYFYMRNPEMLKNVPVVGSEDPLVGEQYERVNGLQRMNDALKKVIQADDQYWDSKSNREREEFKSHAPNIAFLALLVHVYSSVQNMDLSSMGELESMIDEIEEQAFPWIRGSLDSLFDAFRVRARANFDRDRASARNLAYRYQTGIHFVGLNHFKNTLNNLQQICESELSNTSTYSTQKPHQAVQ